MRDHNVRSSNGTAFARIAAAFAASLLVGALLAAAPVGLSASCLAAPGLAWAAGADEAPGTADTADAAGAADGQGSGAADGQGEGASAGGASSSSASTQQASAAASAASSAQSSASSSSSAASSSTEPSADRGYVGPWYALNHSYVTQVEDRFDAITDEEYATTLTRTVLIAVAGVAAVLAIIAFVRAHRIQSRVGKKRR